jgi:hypothetical protein
VDIHDQVFFKLLFYVFILSLQLMAQSPTSKVKSEAMKSDAQKLDYASLISETKTYIDRLEQMLISCDLVEFKQ